MSNQDMAMVICIPRKCLVCFRPAYCNNYGAYTCDACKMFFRRVNVEHLNYRCKLVNDCFNDFNEETASFPKCKACRYQRCLSFGMNFEMREVKKRRKNIMEVRNTQQDNMMFMVKKLLLLNEFRMMIFSTHFTDTDPTVRDLAERRDMKTYQRASGHVMCPHDWSFFALYTTADFLLNLDFMQELETDDKAIILKHFIGKGSLFAGAMRTFLMKRDRLTSIDGTDIYPDEILKLGDQSFGCETDTFLNRIRSLLVAKLIDLGITNEEYVLINAILCCNTALPGLSEHAKEHIDVQQKAYSSVLFQYCQATYQHSGPARFNDLLSLYNVMSKNFEDVQYLTMVVKLMVKGTHYRKLIEEVV